MDIALDIEAVRKLAHDLEGAGPVIGGHIKNAMRAAIDTLEQAVTVRTPVGATEALRGSIATDMYGDPLSGDFSGAVFTPSPYGEHVENGRPPGQLDKRELKSLEYWAVRKLGVPYGRESASTAWALFKHISEFGTRKPPARMFAQGLEAAEPYMLKAFEAVPDKIIKDLNL